MVPAQQELLLQAPAIAGLTQSEPESTKNDSLGQSEDTSAVLERHDTPPQLSAPLSVLSLKLSPPQLERQFWQCLSAENVCQIMDLISLGFTLANHSLLLIGGTQQQQQQQQTKTAVQLIRVIHQMLD
jgi:hypothetical protein